MTDAMKPDHDKARALAERIMNGTHYVGWDGEPVGVNKARAALTPADTPTGGDGPTPTHPGGAEFYPASPAEEVDGE